MFHVKHHVEKNWSGREGRPLRSPARSGSHPARPELEVALGERQRGQRKESAARARDRTMFRQDPLLRMFLADLPCRGVPRHSPEVHGWTGAGSPDSRSAGGPPSRVTSGQGGARALRGPHICAIPRQGSTLRGFAAVIGAAERHTVGTARSVTTRSAREPPTQRCPPRIRVRSQRAEGRSGSGRTPALP